MSRTHARGARPSLGPPSLDHAHAGRLGPRHRSPLHGGRKRQGLTRRGLARLSLLAGLAGAAVAATAGQACEQQPISTAALSRGLALAQATAQRLEASGASVVLLARAGQDLSAYGLRWSHLGWAYRTTATTTTNSAVATAAAAAAATPAAPPVWRVLHKLNRCGTDQAQVHRQGLGEFFLDQPHRYEAAIVVPGDDVQVRLWPLLQDNRWAGQWHTPRYSLVAYPWAQRYQQSNQWAIETLAGAMDPAATDRPRAQAWLQARGYQPSVLHIPALQRLGARATSAHIAFDDHPPQQRFADRIDTVSADSVFSWLHRSGLAGPVQTLR